MESWRSTDESSRNLLEPGMALLDRFLIERPLGQGGMATTYLAHDRLWSTEVAIKQLRLQDEAMLEAFYFEFSTLRSLDHPNLIQVHDFAVLTDQGASVAQRCVYTADFVDGVTLEELGREGSWSMVRGPLCDTLSALRLLHAVGIRHGDVKPENILVDGDGRGVLIDLGCARPLGLDHPEAVSGTPGFMAPEQLAGRAADHRADLYGVGRTMQYLFELLSGSPPDAVSQLAARLCRPRPEERPSNVEEVLEHLGVETVTIHPVVAQIGRSVGRQEELREVRALFDDLLEGRRASRVVHLCGADGVGRSHMIREIKWVMQQRCQVIEANAVAHDGISRLIDVTRISRGLAAGKSEILSIVELFERLVGGGASPIVWIIDDVHFLDEDQRRLLDICLRLIESGSELCIVLSSLPEVSFECTCSRLIELGPLSRADMDQWLGSSLSERTLGLLERATGGYPAAIASLLQRMAAGRTTEEGLFLSSEGLSVTGSRAAMVSTLSYEEQRALGLLSILGVTVLPDIFIRFGVDRASLIGLVESGLVARDGAGWKLLRAGEGEHLASILDRALVQQLHEDLASWFGERYQAATVFRSSSELAARQALHLAQAGRTEDALRRTLDNEAIHRGAPMAWWRVAGALSSSSDDPDIELTIARLERSAGRTGEALNRLQILMSAALPDDVMARARIERSACHLGFGRASEAITELEELIEGELDSELKALALHLLAQSCTAQGQYQEASRHAEAGLELCHDRVLRADLLEASGVALSFVGDPSGARERLDRGAELLSQIDDPRRQVRSLGSRALMSYNTGDLTKASEDHRRALDLAEQVGLNDQAATAALNLGTVNHQRGEWAGALRAYERGLRMSVALGQGRTEALLRYDLAKLYSDVGMFERALLMADGCEAISKRIGLEMLVLEVDSIRGEVAFARGEHERAEAFYRSALLGYLRLGSPREQVEIELRIADVMVSREETEQAAAVLQRCQEQLISLDARDVDLRHDLVRARLLLTTGQPQMATRLTERVAHEARQMGLSHLEAESEALAAMLWAAQGGTILADNHRRRAREIWERSVASLQSSVRDAFWRHPGREVVVQESSSTTAPAIKRQSALKDPKIQLLLDINKRLKSSLTTSQVLSRAMDAAIELTRAERGFLLLAEEGKGELKVAVARNFDRERIESSHVKFSHGIAEQVIASGSPLITADAQRDGRLHTKASVHAMNLTSVLCVPVSSPEGVQGALYLDNRFQKGLFSEEEEALLLAFADQVAIALSNARLHDELKRRNRELEAERQRVDELLKDQAEAIDRLTEEVKHHQISREHRFDYSLIVGKSRAIEDVFDLLDRIIDAELSVLILGESGTGKELCARAIHQNSPRSRTGRLVSINCGALPETLLESELFGYERGAFTGADQARQGLIVQAQEGTLFLDEVSEMPPAMQVKLLRVLQEREVQPLGSTRTIPVDFRLLCATNRHLSREVDQGGFRQDLFYRISTVELTLPPLRERRDDIPELVTHFLLRIAQQMHRSTPEITSRALRKLSLYDWPGNVRQLEHTLTKSVVLCDGNRITVRNIELPQQEPQTDVTLDRKTFERTEVSRIAEALEANRWNISKVSRLLGIPRSTLYRRIKFYGLKMPEPS